MKFAGRALSSNPSLMLICTMALSMQCVSAVPKFPHLPFSLSAAFPCLWLYLVFQAALQAEECQTA